MQYRLEWLKIFKYWYLVEKSDEKNACQRSKT